MPLILIFSSLGCHLRHINISMPLLGDRKGCRPTRHTLLTSYPLFFALSPQRPGPTAEGECGELAQAASSPTGTVASAEVRMLPTTAAAGGRGMGARRWLPSRRRAARPRRLRGAQGERRARGRRSVAGCCFGRIDALDVEAVAALGQQAQRLGGLEAVEAHGALQPFLLPAQRAEAEHGSDSATARSTPELLPPPP